MKDEDLRDFAEVLVDRGARVQQGENVYIMASSLEALPLFEEVRRQVMDRGGNPHEHLLYDSQIGSEGIDRDMLQHSSREQLESMSEAKLEEMKRMDAYIRIGGTENPLDMNEADSGKITTVKKATEEILEARMDTKWVTTRYPTSGLAQLAGMPTEKFQRFVVDSVTGVDWETLESRNQEVKKVFDGAESVRVEAEGTDLEFSLSGREGETSVGRHNLPDGEVFYAPRKNSVNGEISFRFPGVQNGRIAEDVRLVFEDGKVVEASASSGEKFLKEMLETDEGARYIGEFGIGTNRQIDRHVKNTLFDEKIGGTVHFALGRAYERCVPEGEERNRSGIHWDIVEDLRTDGRIYVDGEKVMENGKWLFL